MRVLQVHWTFPPTTGGVESHLADLASGLATRDCDVTVLTGESQPEPIGGGVRLISTPLLDLERIRAGEWDPVAHIEALTRELANVVGDVKPSVVHGHNLHHFSPGPAIALDRLAPRFGFAIHHTFHETWPDVLHDTPVYRGWAGNYAVSAHVRNECGLRLGFYPDLRPLGINVTRFGAQRELLEIGRSPVILHPARLLPWKGVHTSVAMLAELRRLGIDARLVITDTARIADWEGELAEYRRHVLDLATRLGVQDLMSLQPAAYRDMPALYDAADIVIYPTVAAEPYGLVPLEAMSSQRPVVASRCGGIVETLVDGVTGWLVTPENSSELAARVAELIGNPSSARAMGRAGRQHVVANFDLEMYVDRMLDSYRRSVADMDPTS